MCTKSEFSTVNYQDIALFHNKTTIISMWDILNNNDENKIRSGNKLNKLNGVS